jgi:transcriptional regulator with XRE-family HTH domain
MGKYVARGLAFMERCVLNTFHANIHRDSVTLYSPDQLEAFGRRLEAARRYYGRRTGQPRIKMNAFANALGLQARRYARYEAGELEPPLSVLDAIRRLTGLSLDWLISDLPPGEANLPGLNSAATPGDRLRWAREILEPNAAAAAQVMLVSIPLWNAYEAGQTPIPLTVAQEFARRFQVSLDYLYEGRLEGVTPRMRDALLAQHPQLSERARSHSIDTPLRDDSIVQPGLSDRHDGQ